MLFFDCDYNNGMHPAILRRFGETNGEYTSTYGYDVFSASARERIREACGDPSADVFFLAGGTQTNSVVIDCLLKPWQGVVSAVTGHINVHEAGAIEYTGHKVFALPEHDGRISARELEALVSGIQADETFEHMADPALVYISFPSETGTLYTAAELADIRAVCGKYGLKLFIDGARLGYGLAAEGNDVTLKYLAAHCDAFYIGGTKVGAICGEAVVFPRSGAPEHFFTRIKQHGALLAKGRLVGLQFDTLFTDGLYMQIGRDADGLAMRLRDIFTRYGLSEPASSSKTNQQFFILEHRVIEKLRKEVCFEKWAPVDATHDMVRFVTSWATTHEDVDALENLIRKL